MEKIIVLQCSADRDPDLIRSPHGSDHDPSNI